MPKKDIDITLKQAKARDMYLDGWSNTAIAKELGWKDVSSVKKAIKRILDVDKPAPRDMTLTLSLLRLESITGKLYRKSLEGDLEATKLLLKAMERQAKMLGLDAPTKVAETDAEGRTVRKLPAGVLAVIQQNVYGSSNE